MRLALLRLAFSLSSRNIALTPVKSSCAFIEYWNIFRNQPKLLHGFGYHCRAPSARQHEDNVECEQQQSEIDGDDRVETYGAADSWLRENQNEAASYLLESSSEYVQPTSRYPSRNPSEPISDFMGQTSESSTKLALSPLRLEYESNISPPEAIGGKLIDDPRYKNDFGLWRELLEYRRRHHGNSGVVNIWKGFTGRCDDIDLPIEGEDADFLWKSFIMVGLQQEWLLRELQAYAEDLWKRTGKRWRRFYEEVVGGHFKRGHPHRAVEWHLRLKQIHLGWPNEVVNVFPQALSTKAGLKCFKAICKNVDGHKIYSIAMPHLWKHDRIRHALAMHDFLMSRQDGPRTLSEIEPLLKYVEMYGSEKQHSYFVQQLVKAGLMSNDCTSNAESSHSQAEKEEANGTPKLSPKALFNDEFGARLFATKALTFELILAGLKMFGVDIIGPLTLREMALRTRTVEELVSQLVALKKSGISTGDSVFSKVVVKLSFSKSTMLLHDVLQSDQHPDVFEDMRIQESLLATYTLAEDWRQVNKTLAIMSVISNEDPHSYNVLFRNALRVNNWDAAMQQFEAMRKEGVQLSETTIKWMQREILPRRRKSRRPSQDKASIDALRRLICMYQQVIMSGGRIPPEAWTECMKRLGMYNLWYELEKLCFWLIPVYGPIRAASSEPFRTLKPPELPAAADPDTFERRLPAAHSSAPLRRIFGPRLQEAIVAWGFILRPNTNSENRLIRNPFSKSEYLIPWVRGIILLRQLRAKGVIVQTSTVQSACRVRLAMLFSDYRQSNRLRNRMLRRENPWLLRDILMSIHKAWGQPIFLKYGSNYHKLVNPTVQPVQPGRWTQTADNYYIRRPRMR
ncbi:hypothetical protein PRK78_007243 [Emydomyces testavorans]|uniref:Pentatricopeptide repeat-containing protein n=1 Tax=Emydomyces testavorans TaxID=2070801 RepID=A0AAF0DMX2_9EURO|nr:hypothetical protein PRK78_007243 [Emydomyces testavorans]